MKKSVKTRALAITCSVVIFFGGGELLARWILPPAAEMVRDERYLTYRYDARLGWFPQENSEHTFQGLRRIQVRHNPDGFRDHDFGQKVKPRLIFMGDSFVWGYDAETEERFTDRLQARLPLVEVMNLGVSGYGPDQEYLLAQQTLAKFQPDLVVLVFCVDNDHIDAATNFQFAYYKPYYVDVGGALELRGVPVPRSLAYFYAQYPLLLKSRFMRAMVEMAYALREPPKISTPDLSLELVLKMKSLVESLGARFLIVLNNDDPKLEPELRARDIPYLNMAPAPRFPKRGNHWTPEGHDFVAQHLDEYLRQHFDVATLQPKAQADPK
jgi:GDSL-like Lipase/Acylhydrolase family